MQIIILHLIMNFLSFQGERIVMGKDLQFMQTSQASFFKSNQTRERREPYCFLHLAVQLYAQSTGEDQESSTDGAFLIEHYASVMNPLKESIYTYFSRLQYDLQKQELSNVRIILTDTINTISYTTNLDPNVGKLVYKAAISIACPKGNIPKTREIRTN